MAGLTPHPGLVIRYAYLWSHEAEAGQEEGVKDRPCAVLLAVEGRAAKTSVVVLPVTHSPPHDPTEAIEIPAAVKLRLGLDAARSWVILTEVNHFRWPGPDIRPVVGGGLSTAAFGTLPGDLYRRIRDAWLALNDRGRVAQVARSE